jgi:RimJ/RimL family protein N-acetyltransferase
MRLQGKRVTIRPMRRSDMQAMARWRRFADPLYQPFDFPRRSMAETYRWYEWRSQDPNRRLHTIENEDGQVIGSLTLRGIDQKRSARLGITIGADFVSQGYGTEALHLFFDHYFGEMEFTRLVLDVAATNLRAIRAYRSLGFREVGRHYQPASHHSFGIIRQDPHYQHLRPLFQQRGAMWRVLFLDMALTREEWWARQLKEDGHG